MTSRLSRRGMGLLLILLLAATPAVAQVASGNIYGTVTDESGAIMPGASVTLSSDFGTQDTTSSSDGTFRFLNLQRGTYKLRVSLTGFSKVEREVPVTLGSNVEVRFP